eukprot:TRINITY_DN13184_c0_g2_i1.p2 TRINITY_DN13184_c0_g2~~TRINITY_DN13184_c0_g2_i1.p2  ORF type:complete len:232 (+),score=73.37 TRINITY_DN13184_c0_g2_i1:235-930(+)
MVLQSSFASAEGAEGVCNAVKTDSPSHSSLETEGETLFKIAVVGDEPAGKSSLIHRYVHGSFKERLRQKGVSCATKIVAEADRQLTLQIYEVGREERVGRETQFHLQGTSAAFICIDSGVNASLGSVLQWKDDVARHGLESAPCILLVCRTDLCPVSGFSARELDHFCAENGFDGWFETSAKTGAGVDKAFQKLVGCILQNSAGSVAPIPYFPRRMQGEMPGMQRGCCVVS